MNLIKGSHSIEVIYFATLTGHPEDIVLHPDDHAAGLWFSHDELDTIYKAVSGDGPEYHALQKAFQLLNGDNIDLAAV